MLSPSESTFPAPFDQTTKIVSVVVSAVLAAAAWMLGSPWAAGFLLLILLCYAFSPRDYTVAASELVIRRRFAREVRLPRNSIHAARKATAADLAGTLRLWGNGGLFGYYGLFRTTTLGTTRWYVSDRNRLVVLFSDSRPVLISPDDPERFLAALGAPEISTQDPATTSPRRRFAVPLAGAAMGALALGVVAFALLYDPGPPSYTLTPGALTIHDRFYAVTVPADSVDIARIRIVDIGEDFEWRPTARTNGFANAHYRAGWFRVTNGQRVRMYRASGTRLVLLPPKSSGTPVLLEVADPARFIGEIRQIWSR